MITWIFGGNPLRHDHGPRVNDELAHLRNVDRVQPHPNPVVTQVGLNRHGELLRLRGDQRGALLLRKAEAHRPLVPAERRVHDPAHSKLDLISDQRLFRPWQGQRNGPDVIRCDHRAVTALLDVWLRSER
jgi:hypothetical protein